MQIDILIVLNSERYNLEHHSMSIRMPHHHCLQFANVLKDFLHFLFYSNLLVDVSCQMKGAQEERL